MVAGDWEMSVAAPFRRFAANNIRTGPILRRLLPWNWFRSSTGVRALAGRYRQELTNLALSQLPARPNFVYCATDMAFGVNWVFERTRVGDYRAGYTDGVPDWPLARAVAASSCFPPVFNPLPIALSPDDLRGGDVVRGRARDDCIRGLRLTDGGNYDNLGLEPIWKSHSAVLVSDGGGVFGFEGDRHLLWRLSRYTEIQGNQSLALRKRWLMAGFARREYDGAYWGIGSLVENYQFTPAASYGAGLVKDVISKVRTDLDAFSDAERKVLENHGYILAEVAVQRHAAHLIQVPAPFKVPHGDWMDENRVRTALKNSHQRKLPLGRR
jgi:NTE family protein